ncbi:MAG: hypothetical protein R6X18_06335 [Chloroflexota bacterium]|jgi:hypothetical protein
MVSYKVRRLHDDGDRDRRYHLFDRTEQLLLVADLGSAWLSEDNNHQVRFARPNGDPVATMNLPQSDERRPGKGQNYAIIYDHAVYALISPRLSAKSKSDLMFDRLEIEVEGQRWLALCWPGGEEALLVIYDAMASDIPTHIDPASADLPEPIGVIEDGGEEAFNISLPAGRLSQGHMVGLALVLLIDANL